MTSPEHVCNRTLPDLRVLTVDSCRRRPRPTIGALALVWGLSCALLQYGRRKLSYAIIRRRMNSIRRNPEAVLTALRSSKNLLIVCHGNIIRSPFAASLLSQALRGAAAVRVSSGGLQAVPGSPPHPLALSAAGRRGVDLTGHASAPLDPATVATADLIFVMDIPQLVELRSRFPHAATKTFLLACLVPDLPLEVRDPVCGDESMFEACFDHVTRAVDPVLRAVSSRASDGKAVRFAAPGPVENAQ